MKRSKSLKLAGNYLGKEVELVINRPLGSKHPKYDDIYPVNDRFVPGTQAPKNRGQATVFC